MEESEDYLEYLDMVDNSEGHGRVESGRVGPPNPPLILPKNIDAGVACENVLMAENPTLRPINQYERTLIWSIHNRGADHLAIHSTHELFRVRFYALSQ